MGADARESCSPRACRRMSPCWTFHVRSSDQHLDLSRHLDDTGVSAMDDDCGGLSGGHLRGVTTDPVAVALGTS